MRSRNEHTAADAHAGPASTGAETAQRLRPRAEKLQRKGTDLSGSVKHAPRQKQLSPTPADAAPAAPAKKSSSRDLAKALVAANAAIDKKALEPVLIDLSESHSYADFLLVVSARSGRGIKAIAEHVVETMGESGHRTVGVEGVREGRWALIDFGDVVVHVFDQPLREFYDLEGMWFDAPRVALEVPPEQRSAARASFDYDLDDGEDAAELRG